VDTGAERAAVVRGLIVELEADLLAARLELLELTPHPRSPTPPPVTDPTPGHVPPPPLQ
jgi:hypothetical protein